MSKIYICGVCGIDFNPKDFKISNCNVCDTTKILAAYPHLKGKVILKTCIECQAEFAVTKGYRGMECESCRKNGVANYLEEKYCKYCGRPNLIPSKSLYGNKVCGSCGSKVD